MDQSLVNLADFGATVVVIGILWFGTKRAFRTEL